MMIVFFKSTLQNLHSSAFWVILVASVSYNASAQTVVSIDVDLPKLNVSPYHRPYVAIWLETPDRKAVATLAVWAEDGQWLKDLRQWWRKVGRKAGVEVDAVSGATRTPGKHRIHWDGKNNVGEALATGEYLLNVEASREEGGRTYVRQKIVLGNTEEKVYVTAKDELGQIEIHVLN